MTNHDMRDRNGSGVARGLFGPLALLLALVVSTTGCDILDVENPNNLVQEDITQRSAASAVVNGALSTVARGVASMSAPYSTTTDELTWIGSRDAWNQLDQGNVVDPANEFVDAAFPFLAEGRWMADEAIEIVRGHIEEESSAGLQADLARALLIGGVVYASIADMMEDFSIASDRMEAGEPVGAGNMGTLYDQAITYLGEAITIAQTQGLADIEANALAMRARAAHDKAVWQKINAGTPADPIVDAGAADAGAVVAMKGFGDWMYQFTYSASTVSSSVAFQVNERGELQLGEAIVSRNTDDSIDEFIFTDPITGEVDSRVVATANTFLAGSEFSPLTLASNREMHLILAESRLAQGDTDGFEDHINHVRVEITGVEAYTGQIPAVEILEHERQANLFLQNRRLADLYRFGLSSPEWRSGSTAFSSPGTMLPITCIEVRANPNIDNPGC